VTFRPPITTEKRHGTASQEHDLPLVRRRGGGRSTLLRRDVPRFLRRRSAPRTGGLSVREERGRVDGRAHRAGHPLPRPPPRGIPRSALSGAPLFTRGEPFARQRAAADQAETDRYWDAIVGNGGQESACGWCKDRWGLSWQITPRVLTEALAKGGDVAKRAFEVMMGMKKIDVAAIKAARRG